MRPFPLAILVTALLSLPLPMAAATLCPLDAHYTDVMRVMAGQCDDGDHVSFKLYDVGNPTSYTAVDVWFKDAGFQEVGLCHPGDCTYVALVDSAYGKCLTDSHVTTSGSTSTEVCYAVAGPTTTSPPGACIAAAVTQDRNQAPSPVCITVSVDASPCVVVTVSGTGAGDGTYRAGRC